MKKLTELVLGDDELVFSKQENGQEFRFRCSYSGVYMAKKLEAIAVEFKKLDKNARLYMVARTDFYA